MPMKLTKTESENELKVERILHAKRYSLTLDKNLCVGCEICQIICPREAIEVKTVPKGDEEKARSPTVDVDEQRCQYCGICNTLCPFGAMKVSINGEHVIPVVDSESFPQLIREIEVDSTKCDLDCVESKEACPLDLIKISVQTPEGEEVTDVVSHSNKKNLSVNIDVKKNLCPGCRLCEVKFPKGTIRVREIFHGVVKIDQDKCPEGCRDCLDVCPITGTLYLDDDGKVHVNELSCVYCGVCKLVCPKEEALELHRTYVRHTPVRSGAWNKALEKLTSTAEMAKELRTKSSMKKRESLQKRFAHKEAS